MNGIKIESDGTHQGTKVYTEAGSPMFGVSNALVTIRAGRPVLAELEILTESFVVDDVVARFEAKHPVTGALKRVKRVEFEDGSTWEDQ